MHCREATDFGVIQAGWNAALLLKVGHPLQACHARSSSPAESKSLDTYGTYR